MPKESSNQVTCIYCGQSVADNIAHCEHCGGVSHFQERGYRAGARHRFFYLVIGVSVFSLSMAFLLPR